MTNEVLVIPGELPASLTPKELDDIDPKELEYRCSHAAALTTPDLTSHSAPTFLAAFSVQSQCKF